MRYKKGSKVEVLRNSELLSGSWHCAEIIYGNGHSYNVRYDAYLGSHDRENLDWVSKEQIRPCPPQVKLSEDWIPGDVVEVYCDFSWKMATISKVLAKSNFVVRLVGTFNEFVVGKCELRVRQLWKDDEWVVIRKSVRTYKNEKCKKRHCLKNSRRLRVQLEEPDARMNMCMRLGSTSAENKASFQEPHIVLSRSWKRGSIWCCSQVEACEGISKKIRMSKEEGWCQVPAANPFSVEKVDITSNREMLGEKFIYPSFNNKMLGFSEMDMLRERKNCGVGCSTSKPNVDSDDSCSIGSCSVTSNSPHKLQCNFNTDPVADSEDHLSDAESFCHLRFEERNVLLPTKEELAAEIHRLELHAYRCTIEALHASGPLSWEKETLVTNLRILLHISNDEHLMELKNLISTT